MNTATLLVDSVTYGIKARKALLAKGIRSSLKKVNTTATGRGCRYALIFEQRHLFEAMAELERMHLPYERWRGEPI